MDIGEKLRQLRLQRNLTQEEMADHCELSKGFISQVERNLASPSIATLTDMLECLGSDLKEFFSDRSDEKIVFSRDDMLKRCAAPSPGWYPAPRKTAWSPFWCSWSRRDRRRSFLPTRGKNSATCCRGSSPCAWAKSA